jgi:hypothetical protein
MGRSELLLACTGIGRGGALGCGQLARALILTRLWVRSPCPTQIRAPSAVRSAGQGADLDQVVGQDSVSDPNSCSFGGVDPAAVPSVAAFQAADPAFASGSPLQVPPECPPVFLGLPGLAGSAFAGDDDVADAEVVQGVVDTGFAVSDLLLRPLGRS